jgi:tRNA pseudouridine55 synthase
MFLLVDKPKGITSHDVIYKLRKLTGTKRIGHAGTLDPNATGLLIVGIGRASTKLLGDLTKNTKKGYEATIFLGEERDTDDAEGKVTKKYEITDPPSKEKILAALVNFTGKSSQIPPAHSAIKIKGKKAYELARKGRVVNLKPREITVYKAHLLDYTFPTLKVFFEVGSGTYIRALARDIGRGLKVGGFLKDLRRVSIDKYKVEAAHKLEGLTQSNWESYTIQI